MHQPEMTVVEVPGLDVPSVEPALSPWTESRAKRIFDIAAVLAFAPILTPLLLIIGLAVLLICRGPILFRQLRIGHSGKPFWILKFRTMRMSSPNAQSVIAAISTDNVTPLGRILRRLKLDELPQVLNVLVGDMSLVGPRPKIPDQQTAILNCKPGITGSATLIFAREEWLLRDMAKEAIPNYYRTAILPMKAQLDADYMRRATFLSDLRILIDTVLGNW